MRVNTAKAHVEQQETLLRKVLQPFRGPMSPRSARSRTGISLLATTRALASP